MSMKNTKDSYGTIAKTFHWGIAITIYCMLPLGYFLDSIKPQRLQDLSYIVHESIGIMILTLIVARFVWKLTNPSPALPSNTPLWQRVASRLVHYGLYAALIIMPLSGWVMATSSGYFVNFLGLGTLRMPGVPLSKNLASQAHEVHEVVALIIISLIVIHVIAALKHHFVDKDNVLKRMLPTFKNSNRTTTAQSSNISSPQESL